MKIFCLTCFVVFIYPLAAAFGRSNHKISTEVPSSEESIYNYSLSTTWLTLDQFWSPENINVHMTEVHLSYKLSQKNNLLLKAATWRLFQPMGMQYWEFSLTDKSHRYQGFIREFGVGVGYQRFLTEHWFTSIEILPLMKLYLNPDKETIKKGFKLYTSYHIGYHFSFLKNRFFIEPQIHCNYWPIDTDGPKDFKEKERKWDNYFLFEPNIFFGFKF